MNNVSRNGLTHQLGYLRCITKVYVVQLGAREDDWPRTMHDGDYTHPARQQRPAQVSANKP
jgi:hypothetical protein